MWENQTGEEEQCHQAVVNKAKHFNLQEKNPEHS